MDEWMSERDTSAGCRAVLTRPAAPPQVELHARLQRHSRREGQDGALGRRSEGQEGAPDLFFPTKELAAEAGAKWDSLTAENLMLDNLVSRRRRCHRRRERHLRCRAVASASPPAPLP